MGVMLSFDGLGVVLLALYVKTTLFIYVLLIRNIQRCCRCSNIEFAYKGDLRPLIQCSPSLSHFHQQIIHTIFTSGDVIR